MGVWLALILLSQPYEFKPWSFSILFMDGPSPAWLHSPRQFATREECDTARHKLMQDVVKAGGVLNLGVVAIQPLGSVCRVRDGRQT